MVLDPKLATKLDKNGPFDLVIECQSNGKPAAAGFTDTRLAIIRTGFSGDVAAPCYAAHIVDSDAVNRRVRLFGMEVTITLPDEKTAREFDVALATRSPATERSNHPAIAALPRDRVTTLQILPGWDIVRVLGAITELSATSGLTATMKGTDALDRAMARLRTTAAEMGANAIVGLTSSAFGAAGGITSAFGGDAVGVLLIGTAVVVASTATGERPDPASMS